VGPAAVILGLGGVGVGVSAILAIFWHLAAGLILGVPWLWWFGKQLLGEIELEWECRKPVDVIQPFEQVIQDLPPRLPARRPRRAIEAPRPRLPIIAQAEVIEVRREC
jgi:hypothetical protein